MSYICGMFQTSFTIRRGDSRGKQLSSSILLLGLEFSIARYIYTRLSSCKFFSLQPLCMKSHALRSEKKNICIMNFAAQCHTFIRDSVVIFSCWI